MQKLTFSVFALFLSASLLISCSDDAVEEVQPNAIPSEIYDLVSQAGFSTDGLMVFEDGYLVENDIYLTETDLRMMAPASQVPNTEQYSTNNLVSGNNRVITMYAEEGGRKGYSPAMIAGLEEAIARYNALNLRISFARTNNKRNADITMSRLSSRDEQRGVLGSAGFPTSGGDPYNQIKMSGVLESQYGLNTDEIASIIAHEMGHCIGFRHTDWMNRSYSCGSGGSEGSGSVGANHIPGTPTSPDNNSWMLACTDGSNRPFNNNDKTALDYLY